jgi:hypothetical protein
MIFQLEVHVSLDDEQVTITSSSKSIQTLKRRLFYIYPRGRENSSLNRSKLFTDFDPKLLRIGVLIISIILNSLLVLESAEYRMLKD